ncbi:fatty acid--CoA ligase [uncultured Zoogloea sp.]|uniref:fatty acid--CoA ligase n=1 Tax=uncultured Zoogloea sp. TaxID=160237 RepID=UPI00261FFDDB|nr:fatty acid--CoA ligase [uncultured Zoogloea sp.]
MQTDIRAAGDAAASADQPYAYPLLIKQLLHTPLAHAPDQEIVYRDVCRHTYRDLGARIGRLGSALSRLGVGFGDTVAVADWDSHRYLESYFAIPMLGAVLMTVNVRLSPEQIAYTIDHCGAETLLINTEFLPILDGIRDRLPKLKRIVLLSDEPCDPAAVGAVGEYEALLAAADSQHAFPDFDENTRATTFYTTGTTGLPKGVFFSHRQLVLHTLGTLGGLAGAVSGQRFHRGDVYMPITPMFHVHAWGLPYVATMLGVKQVYPGRYVPDMLLQLRRTEGVTFSHCVPTILQMLLLAPAAKEMDLSGWKMVIGGSAFTVGLATQAVARGMDVFTGYGMSETCPILTLAQLKPADLELPPEQTVPNRCRTGLPIPLVNLRIVDGNLDDVAHDDQAQGEVVVRAPWLTQGYLKDADATAHLWRGGWLHTQDIGRIAPSGSLQITDRIKDVIKSGGEWISSLEIETLISQHPAVAEVAVLGVPDARWGERPLPVVVPKAGAEGLTADDIIAHLRTFADAGRISRFAVPDQVRFADSLEKTSVGKINKRQMRERYAAG